MFNKTLVNPTFSNIFIIIFFTFASPALSATYYASPTGSGSTCSTSSRCSLTTGVGLLGPGNTLILGDGTYNQRLTNIPSGTAGNYSIIKAEHDGLAIISNNTNSEVLNINGSFIQVEGLKVINNSNPADGGLLGPVINITYPSHHNKILRTAAVATPCTHGECFNRANVSVSGTYNLIEDVWAWGGGRYKFIVFGGDGDTDGHGIYGNYNILRRAVARHDREWADWNPQGAFQVYQAGATTLQNCIVIDSDQIDYYGTTAGLTHWYGPYLQAKGTHGLPLTIDGSMVINFRSQGTQYPGSYSSFESNAFNEGGAENDSPLYPFGDVTVRNFSAWNGGGGLLFAGAGGEADRDITVSNIFVGNTTSYQSADYEYVGCGVSSSRFDDSTQPERTVVTNSVFTQIDRAFRGGHGLHNVKGANDYNVFYDNYSNYSTGAEQSTAGTHDTTTTNPIGGAIKYLTRVETGVSGPTILKKIGVSGTLYGETGWDTVTSENLWPWPNEDRIKTDMSSYPSNWPADGMPSPVRGFTAGNSMDGTPQTLTKYIWESLGNQIPPDIYNKTPDTTIPTVTAFTIPTTANSLTFSIPTFTATDSSGVTGYLITDNATRPSPDATGWTGSVPTSYTAVSSGAHTLYPWAKDSAGNVSAVYTSPKTVTITVVGDTTAPIVNAFTIPSTASSLTFSVTSLTATDASGVTGYLITESAARPSPDAAGWTGSFPATYTAVTSGAHTLYPWAKDGAGNVSAVYGSPRTVTITIGAGSPPPIDTTAPNVTAFVLPAVSASLTIPVTTFTATDTVGVTGYLVTDNGTIPSPGAAGWTGSPPAAITATGTGTKTFYAWTKDAAGNVSTSKSSAVTVNLTQTGKVYYVRPDGHDAASGLNNASNSSSGAWLTLQKAANTVVEGDTVLVADGTYAGFYVERSGTALAPITFRALGTGANITLRNSRTADGINIESWTGTPANYITIYGFNVHGLGRMGIRAIGGTGIVINNCVVYSNSSMGIFSGNTPSIQVLNNTSHSNGTTSGEHNIYISNALSDNPIIRGNVIRNSNSGSGLQLNGDYEEGGDGYIDNAIIENNVIYGNRVKGMSLISIRYGIIQNNIIYNNGSSAGGIHLVEQGSNYYSINNIVVNNTIDEPNIATIRINANNTGNVVFNNVSLGSTGIVFEGSGNYQSNNSTSTSGFVNRTARDYRLATDSPAKDSGLATYRSVTSPSVDFIGNTRPQNGTFDVGAYEFITTTAAPSPIIKSIQLLSQ